MIRSPRKLVGITILPLLAGIALHYLMLSRELNDDQANEIVAIRTRMETNIANELQGRIETAWSIVNYYYKNNLGQDACLQAIGAIRFDDTNYIWIHQADPENLDYSYMLMHPDNAIVRKNLTGMYDLDRIKQIYLDEKLYDMTDPVVQDIKPVHLFPKFNRVCVNKGGGVVKYYWPKIINGEAGSIGYLKMSYVKYFPEWRWVIGSGAYADHIDGRVRVEMAAYHERIHKIWAAFIASSSVIVIGLTLITYYIARKYAKHLIRGAKELERMAKEAQASSESKGRFLATMSHEIRTPLNSILGFGDLLAEDKLSDTQRDYVLAMQEAAKSLLNIINDILDFSKIEAGKIELEIVRFRVHSLIYSIESIMNPLVAGKDIEFKVMQVGRIPQEIKTDPIRLQQCLINLVNNAIKFTSSGHVHLKVRYIANGGDGVMQFMIEDTGIGIAKEKQDKVFEEFEQADKSTTRRFGGTGLGLAITKSLVEMLHGRISIISEEGQGTTFVVEIPTGVPDTEKVMVGSPKYHENRDRAILGEEEKFTGKVLVAEDVKANQVLIRVIMQKLGVEITLVENGRRAVEAANAVSFDLVFMDMQMPEMDGVTATRLLKESGYKIPIVALTADAMKGDREKYLAAGCDDYLSKPIVRKDLIRVMKKYLTDKQVVSIA